jgi:hypothetical protein
MGYGAFLTPTDCIRLFARVENRWNGCLSESCSELLLELLFGRDDVRGGGCVLLTGGWTLLQDRRSQ